MADTNILQSLEAKALAVRKDLLRLTAQTVVHIGGDLSATDIMTVIWQYAMKYDVSNPAWDGRDRFVLSKGHAAAVTTLCQAMFGCYGKEDVYKEYATDNGRFGMHSCNLINPYVEVSTGSLGHGFPVAAGIAAALRLKGLNDSRVYVVMGDGEQHEGSIWEAAMSARHFGLGNLVAFVDRNGLCMDGSTEDVMRIEPFADKWRAFGWRVVETDGNDISKLVECVDALPVPSTDIPTIIIGNTVKGKGVPFMENNAAWHVGRINTAQYEQAVSALDAEYQRKWGA